MTEPDDVLLNTSVLCVLPDSNLLAFNHKDKSVWFVTASGCAASAGQKEAGVCVWAELGGSQWWHQVPWGSAASLSADMEMDLWK